MLAINGGKRVRDKSKSYPSWPSVTDGDRKLLNETIGDVYRGFSNRKQEFEQKFAKDGKVKHCFAVANGTVSLELILRAYSIGRGDEVILPPYTFIATFSSIVYAGATPVFADISERDYNMDVVDAEKKITDKTKAIVVVAVGGCPPDIDAFESLAKKYGVKLIVDAAQAVGASWRGRNIASCGDAASFSAQNTKNLTCGEGGMITTNDDCLAENLSLLLNGGEKDGKIVSVAQNHNITPFQASVLLSQYEKLGQEILTREKNAAYLAGRIKELDFIDALDYDERITTHAYHLFLFRVNEKAFEKKGITREQFVKALQGEGLVVDVGYMPVYTFPCVSSADTNRMIDGKVDTTSLPVCEKVCKKLCIWTYQSVLLGTREDMDEIVTALKKVWDCADEVRAL